ncbi:hypothetical protein CRG98_017624 [Punica granatum]|uniref:Uncharacterized protein n=1 Tax=Punica granatum TaxID=22663 RepID=A0A2I0K0D4_PUNGR|nr:hypothetical protein CRG98_017624 [Punica granatum]
MTFRNSTRFLEGRFSGRERLPASLRGTSTKNRDHNDPRAPHDEPRAPQDVQSTLRKPRLKSLGLPGPTQHEESGPLIDTRCTPNLPRVPFRSTTLPSRAIAFKGFFTTLTLSREEVVTIRGPINRAQPSSRPFLLYRVRLTFTELYLTILGFSRLRHVRDLPRTPRPTSKESNKPDLTPCRARSSRADPFFHGLPRLPSPGSPTRDVHPESCDSHGRFPDSFPRASRLGNAHLQLREARTFNRCLYEVLMWLKELECTKGEEPEKASVTPRNSRPSPLQWGREAPWRVRSLRALLSSRPYDSRTHP